MNKKTKYIIISTSVALVLVIIGVLGVRQVANNETYVVQKDQFEEVVTCKGEIRSQSYTKINMPKEMMDEKLRIYHVQITDIVEEGTIVKQGDYVATLDQARIKDNLTRYSDRLEKFQNNFKMQKIDSTSQLTDMRNAIKELEFDLKYRKIEIKQAIYESQSYQDKVKRSYDRAERRLKMKRRDYERKRIQYASQCGRIEKEVEDYKERVEKLKEAQKASRVLAPADGMIIYASLRGKTRSKGDHVSRWSPEIAILPDLSKLVVESYIKEIDISKIKIGNQVRVVIDALPDKTYTGELIRIANIGKELSDGEGKVFDVTIKLNGSNPKIAHGMNSSNEIITYSKEDALVIPLDYIFTSDSMSFVYKSVNKEFIPQPIRIERTNDEFAMISEGLQEKDVITINKPE